MIFDFCCPYFFATRCPQSFCILPTVKSAAALLAILLRGKHDHTSRHCRGPCFPGRATRADRNSIACQTKCPGRLLQRGWAPEERRSLAWVTGGQSEYPA